jgi:hypothetical protein
MNYRLSLLVTISAVLFISPPVFSRNGGGQGGGGHGGGGHAGGGSHGGGHFSGGGSSGHSFGHAVGHSLGHIFGHTSGARGMRRGKDPTIGAHSPRRPVRVALIHGVRRRRVHFQNGLFRSGICDSPRFSWRDFLFPGEFDCVSGSFPFDRNTYFWSDSLANSEDSAGSAGPPDTVENELPPSAEKPGAAVPLPSNFEQPVILLQLLDGSMYGLTRYWLEGAELHYVTTYGGENSVTLDRIDLAKTQQLNVARGTLFRLPDDRHNP